MRKTSIFSFFLCLCMICLKVYPDAEFYKNLLNKGKANYDSGKFVEAIQNFKIAEFGLRENIAHLNENISHIAYENLSLLHIF